MRNIISPPPQVANIKAIRKMLTGALLCLAALCIFMACEKDEAKAPGAAGNITGTTANVCPSVDVVLTIATIENATAYQWYKDGTAIATGQSYTVTASGTYTVAGKNNEGEGGKSPAHVVTISGCAPVGAGEITGANANTCPALTVELAAGAIADATSYRWHKDGEAIPDVAAQSYTVTASGTYTVAGVNADGEGTKSPEHVVTIASCAVGAAGTIEGATANACPETEVVLTIGEIEGAVSYAWYRGETKLTEFTGTSCTVTQTGNYTVAGVNVDLDEGTKSPMHQVTITSCVPATPNTPQGTGGAITNNCALSQTALQIYTNYMEGATTVTWYKLDDGGGSASVQSLGTDVEGYLHYDVTSSGTYAVRGVNAWNEGPVSGSIVVTITGCTSENMPPQGTPEIFTDYNDHLRDCGAAKLIDLLVKNLASNGTNPAVTGALSYTFYIYRASAPATPVKLTTIALTGSGDNSNTKWRVAEGGSYTVKASNDIGEGVESEKYVVDWTACPAAAPAWTVAGDVSGCTGSEVELQVTLPFFNAPATYVWYKDGSEVARKTGDNRNKYTVTEANAGVYTVAAVDAEGDGTQTAGRTVTFSDCSSSDPVITDATYADFPASATFKVYDTQGSGMMNQTAAEYNVTVEKGAMGTQLKIIGLGGSEYTTGTVWATFNAANHTVDITSGSEQGGIGVQYQNEDVYIVGANAQDIAAPVKKVDGKIYIYLPASGMPPFSYEFATASAGFPFFFMATGVDATDYHGTGYATVLVQQ